MPDSPRRPTVLTLRLVLALTALGGAVLLLVASFTTVIAITVGTASKVVDADTAQSGWDRHGPALVLLGILTVWLLAAALRGARTAMAGLVLCGVVALAIPTIWDRPHLHDTGSVGDVYADAVANPGTGYYLETLGGALVLVAGGGLLALGGTPIAAQPREPRRRTQPERPEAPPAET